MRASYVRIDILGNDGGSSAFNLISTPAKQTIGTRANQGQVSARFRHRIQDPCIVTVCDL